MRRIVHASTRLLWPPAVLSACSVVLLLACASPASAQIYAWRDANGTLVLSDRPLDTPTHVYEVEGAPAIRTTSPPVPTRAERYDALVQEHAGRHSLRPELVRAVIQVESGFNPRARSPKGAMGLMQLMPHTARELGVRDPYDPADNIRGGTLYLRRLLDRYRGSEELALAAYNAGSGAVERHGTRVPPYRETRDYVRRVGAYAGRDPAVSRATAEHARRGLILYKSIEIIGDRAVPRYSTSPPPSGTFEVIER